MNKKLKLKNYNDGKTKEQIRFFYHRTWSKISKSLNLQPEYDSKKACRRELHYLLCLGELRKKRSIGFGAKVVKQLQELATKGLTYVRQNGRNLRVRPPNRYLRRIYRDISDAPEIILPKVVTVEFLPNSNISFNFVQKHAFNPRIRLTGVSINSKFSEVFDMLNKRFTDLYTNEKLTLYIYPIQSDLSDNDFAEVLVNAENLLNNFEKTQDTNIVVEREQEKPKHGDNLSDDGEENEKVEKEHRELELQKVLPKIFAMHGEKENGDSDDKTIITSNERAVKPFAGYWSYDDAKLIYMRTLFVAFEQKPVLKFKYEWRLPPAAKEKLPFASSSLEILVKFCEAQSETMSRGASEFRVQSPNILYEQKPVIPGILSTQQNGVITARNVPLPLRPRPGRKRTVSHQSNISRVKSPIIPSTTSKTQPNKSLKNAVAVNLIPQPPQLVQYAHLPPDSTRLVNSGSGVREGIDNGNIEGGFEEIVFNLQHYSFVLFIILHKKKIFFIFFFGSSVILIFDTFIRHGWLS